MGEDAAAGYLAGRIDALREHLAALAAALPGLPAAFGRVHDQLAQEWQARPPGTVAGLILGFLVLGAALEAAYRHWVRAADVRDDSACARGRSIGLALAREAGAIATFAVGSAAAFLAFDWPARTRQAVLGFFAAFIVLRLVIALGRALLAPRDARLRILPSDDAAAAFWLRRLTVFAGWFALGWVLVGWLALLGMDLPSRQLVAYLLGLGLLAIGAEAFWRRSRAAALYFVLVWVLWAAGARGLLWTAVVAGVLPLALRLAQAGADHVLRPEGAEAPVARSVLAAALGRGLRALAILGAAVVLVAAFSLDVDALMSTETFWPRLARGALQAIAIVLIADLAWLVIASLIDQRLGAARDTDADARLRTLLPIVRGTVAVVLLVVTVLTVLSALGVQVGPLLASAGVLGIAIGFGAQQLVRDLFAKFSYLLDDAFRVGEYIESGNYKGTVEHLGTRTVRLRHHRGPVFTIPYGLLGAVKNSSRDWVIDKMTIGVAYDTDLDQAKKLIKKIGQELAQDAEFASQILEPLKMQGVEQFSDYAIQIRIKMKTRPNQQFTIRRRAYAMIKKAFAENGIRFATPTVQVAGQGDATAAAARQVLESKKIP